MKINEKLLKNYMEFDNHIIKARCGANGATNDYTYSFGNYEIYTIIVVGMHSGDHYSFRRYLYNTERNVLFLESTNQKGNINLTASVNDNSRLSITNSGSYGAQYEVLIF